MKTDDIDAFVTVVRCQSLSLAAEALQLTQPAITRRVQNLEDDLNVALLDRNTKPLKATPIGLRVYEQCIKILSAMDHLNELVVNEGAPTGVFRIGIPQSLSDVLLLDALTQLNEQFDALQVKVANGWGAYLTERIENQELDAACVLFPQNKTFADNIKAHSLAKMALKVVAPKGLFAKKNYKLSELQNHGWVLNPDGCGFRAGLQRALQDQGLNLQLNVEVFGSQLQLGLVTKGIGLGLVPEILLQNSIYKDQLQTVNVTDFMPLLDLWLIQPQFLGNLQSAVDWLKTYVAKNIQINE
ncbi:MAG: LysR family transcriptional regulator [Acinetobacter sp.]